MENQLCFDKIIKSKQKLVKIKFKNFAEIIFKNRSKKDEDALVLIGHKKDKVVKISLKKLRFVIANLYEEFKSKNIKPGDTVFLADLISSTEYYLAIMLLALTSYGARVFFPFFVEKSELEIWVDSTKTRHIIAPINEINELKGHEKEKEVIKNIQKISQEKNIPLYDVEKDFKIEFYLNKKIPKKYFKNLVEQIQYALKYTSIDNDAIIFTTSGTSGRSKLVLYDQGAYLNNFASWKASGLYDKNKMGNRNIADMLPHTIQIRALMNCLYNRKAFCIFTTDYVKTNPDKMIKVFAEMEFESATFGPSALNLILELINMFPEQKKKIFSNLRTVVSSGTKYKPVVAERYKKEGIILQNGLGTTETQQIMTTLIGKKEDDIYNMHLGEPLAGVELGLKKYDKNSYKLFVKAPFSYKCVIGLNEKNEKSEEFFYTGDIVTINKKSQILLIGRENRDFINSGYGMKVPIPFMKEHYKKLYEISEHVEYFSPEDNTLYMGISALIFISNNKLIRGLVRNKKIIREYAKLIKKLNRELIRRVEPFEYDFRNINRFLIINDEVPKTIKGDPSANIIEIKYKKELDILFGANGQRKWAKNVIPLKDVLMVHIYGLLLKSRLIRKIIMKD
jgi:acyl-coenzyme A synthetase/AMP-(fatty) acid ligase